MSTGFSMFAVQGTRVPASWTWIEQYVSSLQTGALFFAMFFDCRRLVSTPAFDEIYPSRDAPVA